jgi:hypothetical protein
MGKGTTLTLHLPAITEEVTEALPSTAAAA